MMKRICYFLVLMMALSLAFISFIPHKNEVLSANKTFYTTKLDSTRWVLDKSHSAVSFAVTHLVVSKAEGIFKTFDGSLKSSRADFSDAQISFTIDAASVDTESEARDQHLRGEDYFNVEKYPKIRFESTSFKPAGGKKYKLTGNLTLKDVTKPVVFDVVYAGGATKASFACTTLINRYDYNISAGSPAIGKEVTINVKVELNALK